MNNIERFLRQKCVVKVLGENYQLNENQLSQLSIIFSNRTPKSLEYWLRAIAFFVFYDLSSYRTRLKRLQKVSRKRATLYDLFLRYGKYQARKRHESMRLERITHLLNRTCYWENLGHTPQEAKDLVSDVQHRRGEKAALILRGSSEHTIRSASYWIKKGMTFEEANIKVRQIQTTNGIAHYKRTSDTPEIDFKQRIEKWQHSLSSKSVEEKSLIRLKKGHSVESYKARGYSEEDALILSNTFWSKRGNFSKISQTFFKLVEKQLDSRCDVYYKDKNYEYNLSGKFVDFL